MARIESEIGVPKGGFMKWIDDRFPWTETMKYHVTEYYASKNFNWWYIFGVLAMVVLVMQLFTGIFLTMNYKPSADEAFASVRIHYARRGMGLADSLHAFHRRVVFLHRRLPPHVPGDALWLLQEAA